MDFQILFYQIKIKFNTGPNISSSDRALRTLELPINADNSPENVVVNIPIGTI